MIDGNVRNVQKPGKPWGMTTRRRKNFFIEYWFKAKGNISHICNQLGMARKTFTRWMENDPDFREKILAQDEALTDMAETQHYNLIAAGHPPSVQFHLRTKGKDRGYVERVEQEFTGQMNIAREIKITVVHTREDDTEFLKEFEEEINREVLPE